MRLATQTSKSTRTRRLCLLLRSFTARPAARIHTHIWRLVAGPSANWCFMLSSWRHFFAHAATTTVHLRPQTNSAQPTHAIARIFLESSAECAQTRTHARLINARLCLGVCAEYEFAYIRTVPMSCGVCVYESHMLVFSVACGVVFDYQLAARDAFVGLNPIIIMSCVVSCHSH